MQNILLPGKFMPLAMRPHSLNCYAYSKHWHKFFTIDPKIGDITEISKQFKSCLFSDLPEKSEELCLYRGTDCGTNFAAAVFLKVGMLGASI